MKFTVSSYRGIASRSSRCWVQYPPVDSGIQGYPYISELSGLVINKDRTKVSCEIPKTYDGINFIDISCGELRESKLKRAVLSLMIGFNGKPVYTTIKEWNPEDLDAVNGLLYIDNLDPSVYFDLTGAAFWKIMLMIEVELQILQHVCLKMGVMFLDNDAHLKLISRDDVDHFNSQDVAHARFIAVPYTQSSHQITSQPSDNVTSLL